jgi:hypothetical protein
VVGNPYRISNLVFDQIVISIILICTGNIFLRVVFLARLNDVPLRAKIPEVPMRQVGAIAWVSA